MLHSDVREGIASGYLSIYPIKHIGEAYKIVTGHELGITDVYDKGFTKGSDLEKIKAKLDTLLAEEPAKVKPHAVEPRKHLKTQRSASPAKTTKRRKTKKKK